METIPIRKIRLNLYSLWNVPIRSILHSRKPVRNLRFKGLKLRTSGVWLEMVKNLGAAAVTMPGGEVYTSLGRGRLMLLSVEHIDQCSNGST